MPEAAFAVFPVSFPAEATSASAVAVSTVEAWPASQVEAAEEEVAEAAATAAIRRRNRAARAAATTILRPSSRAVRWRRV